jgi:hypothetical protein
LKNAVNYRHVSYAVNNKMYVVHPNCRTALRQISTNIYLTDREILEKHRTESHTSVRDKNKFLSELHIYYAVLGKFDETALHTMLLIISEFHENLRRESCTFLRLHI